MKHAKSARQGTAEALAELQTRHAKRLKKVERARDRLDRASRKLGAVEGQLAALVRERAAAPPDLGAAPRRRASLLFNPQSRGALDGTYRLEQIEDCLSSYGFAAEVGVKTSGRAARELARAAVERGDELLVVVAGDGTIEDVIGELVGTPTALGIIPIGTMNNLARCLGVPLDLDDACALLSMGTTRRIDVGRVVAPGQPRVVHFLESAGVGLSALAAPIGQDIEKGHLGLLLEHLGRALGFKAANVSVACDDGEALQAHTQVVTISNAPLFGKNMLIAPEARMDDGLLDVAVYDGMSKLDLERHFAEIIAGKRADDPRVAFRRARRVRVTADESLEASADLRVLAEQQVWEIDLLPRALLAVAGRGMALTLPVEAAPAVPPLAGPQPAAEPRAG